MVHWKAMRGAQKNCLSSAAGQASTATPGLRKLSWRIGYPISKARPASKRPARTHEKTKSIRLVFGNRLARRRLILPVQFPPRRKLPGMNELTAAVQPAIEYLGRPKLNEAPISS